VTRASASLRRVLFGVLIGVFVALGIASPALADPAGPTDYRSEVVAVEPSMSTVEVKILGGDSFVQLTVVEGTEVFVLGYQGEDYLWFRADGSVLENRRSPSTYLNEERYGNEFPPEADADAEPEWSEVAGGGTYAWHDHRAHWMQSTRPAGASAGDQILEAVIPLRVDGTDVDVTVISIWQEPASPLPIVLGAVAAICSMVVAVFAWRRGRVWTAVLLPIAGLAVFVGLAQFTSLPTETGPRLVWWLLPVLALVAAVVSVIAGARHLAFVTTAAALVAAVELIVWGLIKRDGLSAALIPTDAPGWLDRFATTLALVGGVAVAALALWTLFAQNGARRVSGPTEPGS
jgi:hypothetical protein